MKKFFNDASDKNVANVVFYGDTTDSKLYYTTGTGKEQVTEEDLQHAFLQSSVLVAIVGESATDYLKVVKVSGNKASTVDLASSTVTVTEWTAKAKA